MKIAVVSAFMFGSSIGGVENHIRFICKELLKNGHDIRLFKPVWDHEEENDCKVSDGLEIQYIRCGPQLLGSFSSKFSSLSYAIGFMRKIDYLRTANKVSQEIVEWGPDLVWQHDFSSSWLTTRNISHLYPIVLTNHTGEFLFLKRMPFFSSISKYLLGHYKVVIGPSKELTPEHGPGLAVTIHNGADLSWFHPLNPERKQNLRSKILSDENVNKFLVFCPRRWAPTKGILFLARAIRKIVSEGYGDKFVFVFAGDDYDGYPGYSKVVEKTLEKSGATFIRLGNLEVYEMREWYQIADLVAIPSLMEAVSLAAVEAIACGAPVLATSVGGMTELIRHGENGYLVPPGDSNALAESIKAICEDEGRYSVAAEALTLVRAKYSWEAISLKTSEVLLHAART